MTDEAGPPIKLIVDRHKNLNVHYLESLGINIAVENLDPKATVVIDSLALRFQSRSSPGSVNADPHTTVVHPGGALSIPPAKLGYCTVQVCPNLLFLKYTNVFDVAVSYRLSENIAELHSVIGEGWFVLVEPAPQLFGKVFISYKEPEDRALADGLFEFAKDAGFEPYIAPPDIRTGSRIWGKKIPAAIRDSKFMFVIWTINTGTGPGVKKEIRIARKNGIDIAPLLERKASDPRLFGRDVEYTQFDADNAALTFAEVVTARRSL
jgi:TIR domain-containing protein